jgi:hypothetical protein
VSVGSKYSSLTPKADSLLLTFIANVNQSNEMLRKTKVN